MSFPGDNLRAEMLINGAWTEVTNRIRGSGDIKINSGTRVDSTDLSPSSVDFVLNNADGRFTNDNPMSSLYGLLPANTNFRVSMEEATPFLCLRNEVIADPLQEPVFGAFNCITTTDKAVLDVTGDLDLRIDFEPDTWTLGNAGHVLAGKWETTPTPQRSWAWTLEASGCARFWWSPPGTTAGVLTATSTAVVPAGNRISLRVVMDVNNGAAGNTVTFYTSDSVTGTWTQLGSPVVAAGVTSIFSSTADLGIGYTSFNTDSFVLATTPPSVGLVGRVHRFQMYNGIAGTLVADMNATARSEGDTTWSDGLTTPNTWTVQGNGVITVADYRAYAELSSMPQEWDKTGRDVMVAVDASGVSRRVTKDPKILQSAYRYVNENLGSNDVGYWSCEDPSGSATAFTSTPGAFIQGSNGIGFGSQYFPPGSAPLADLGSTSSFVVFNFAKTTTAGGWSLGWVARYQPFTANPLPLLLTADSADGTDYVVTLDVAAKIIEVFAQTGSGAILADATTTYTDDWSEWHSFVLSATQNAGNVQMTLYWRAVDDTAWKSITANWAGTASRLAVARFNGGDVPPGSTFGHVTGYAGVGSASALIGSDRFSAFQGWTGENAAKRWLRICRQIGIRGLCVGWPADTQMMGPQSIDTGVNVLDDCAATEGAIQYDARDQAAIVFRTRMSLYAQQPLALDYVQAHLSGAFSPVDDDMLTKNSVTASNPDGSTQSSVVASGPKSTQSSPNGVGVYDSGVRANTVDQDGLLDVASYATFQGTWPSRRVPSTQVQLARAPFTSSATLTRAVRAVNLGDRVAVANVPLWVGGGTADMLVRAYTETLQNSGSARGWLFDWASVPGGPFSSVPLLGHDLYVPRLDASTTTTGGTLTTTAASVTFVTPAGSALWVTTASNPAEFPFVVTLAGEWITVTGITGATSPQTAALTRSANGIVKTHASGESVRLASPYYIGR